MFEKYMILTRGFKNIVEHGEALGFELNVRIPYYRGVWLAVISGFELSVDGEAFTHEQMKVRYKGVTYTMPELAAEEGAHWDHGDALTLLVPTPHRAPGLQMHSAKPAIDATRFDPVQLTVQHRSAGGSGRGRSVQDVARVRGCFVERQQRGSRARETFSQFRQRCVTDVIVLSLVHPRERLRQRDSSGG